MWVKEGDNQTTRYSTWAGAKMKKKKKTCKSTLRGNWRGNCHQTGVNWADATRLTATGAPGKKRGDNLLT